MYAIIADSGRQFRVEEGQQLEVDYRDGSSGDDIVFDRVLAVSNDGELQLGTPQLEGAKVTATIKGVTRGKKIFVQKFRRRKTYRRRTGHRQMYTTVQISKIEAP